MSNASSSWGGVWPALMTPLDDEGAPALDRLEQLIGIMIEQGADGLYVLGSTGQGPLLSAQERRTVAERAVKAAGGAVPVMVHVGGPTTDEAVALARQARNAGADAISSVPPYYYPHPPQTAFEHYRAIGEAGEKPFFVYHLEHLRGMEGTPAAYANRLLELPHIAGLKYTSRDLHHLAGIHAAAGEKLTLFSGADEQICQATLSGADGAIGTFYNVFLGPARRARRAFVAGDFDAGFRFMQAFEAMVDEAVTTGSAWGFMRAAMRVRFGLDTGPMRAPLGVGEPAWSDAAAERVIRSVEEAAPDA